MSQLRTQGLQQQQANLQLQQQQLQLASNKAIMQAMAEGGGDLEGTMNAMKNHPNILPQDWLGIQQHAMQIATQRAALTKDELAIKDQQHEQWASLLKAKPIDSQDALNTVIRQGVARGLPVPEEFLNQQGNVMPYTGDPQHYVAMANGLQLLPQLSKQNLEAMQAGEASGKELESRATAAEKKVTTAVTQHKLDLLNRILSNPAGVNAAADIQVPPGQFPNANRALKNQLQVTTDPDKIAEAFQHYADPMVQAELDKAKIPIDVSRAQALIPPEAAKAGATALSTAAAQVSNLPAPWNQARDPETARKGLAETQALEAKFKDSMSAAQDLINVIRANQHGNQMAGAQIPMEQLRAILNRVTNTELGASTEFGTKFRQLSNLLAKNVEGRWSKESLDEFIGLANLRKTGALNEYQAGLNSIGKNYGISGLQPMQLPKGITPAPGQATAAGVHDLKVGSVIRVGDKRYRYNGGGTADMKNYTEMR